METPESELAAEFGGPGPEDFAKGAAALAAGLVREAQALSATAAALRATATANPPGVASGEALSDVRRQRVVLAAAGDAAVRAALAIEAAALLGDDQPAASMPAAWRRPRSASACRPRCWRRCCAPAALDFRTDDAGGAHRRLHARRRSLRRARQSAAADTTGPGPWASTAASSACPTSASPRSSTR
jgi:hypothetical protein